MKAWIKQLLNRLIEWIRIPQIKQLLKSWIKQLRMRINRLWKSLIRQLRKPQVMQLLILIPILAVVLGTYFGLRSWNANREAEQNPGGSGEFLAKELVALKELTELSFTDETGAFVTFIRTGDRWVSADEPDLPLIQDALDKIERELCGLTYERALKEHDALSDYGLDPAVHTVNAADEQGNTCAVLLGNGVDDGDLCYAMTAEHDAVFTVSSDLMDAVSVSLMELVQPETLPAFREEDVKSVTVTVGGESLTLNKVTEKKQQTEMQETGELDENGQTVTEEVTVTVEVYRWNLPDGTRISKDNETLLAMLEELSGLSMHSVRDFRPTAEALQAYELDAAVTIECMDDSRFVLHLGAVDEGETLRCARVDGSDLIHWMSVDKVDTLLSMTEAAFKA